MHRIKSCNKMSGFWSKKRRTIYFDFYPVPNAVLELSNLWFTLCLWFQAVDAVYFNGGSPSGQFFVAATARRHNGFVQTLLYIRVTAFWIYLQQRPSCH